MSSTLLSITGWTRDLQAVAAPPCATVDPWWSRHLAVAARRRRSFDLAVVAGAGADRLAWAFASGYQAAARALLPDKPAALRIAFCATEAGGNHPRAIETRIQETPDGTVVDGQKSFVTFGPQADVLLVIGSTGIGADGRKQLRAVVVPANTPGVHIEPMPELPFVPEIPHASVRFDGAHVAAPALPGDAYTAFLKPFRTIEDIHVHGAVLGHLAGLAHRTEGPREVLARACAGITALSPLADEDPLDPRVHLGLDAALAATRELAADIGALWPGVDEDTRARWLRDQPLLRIAEGARRARTRAARATLGG